MKRDDDLIRELLVAYEGQQDWLVIIPNLIDLSLEDRRILGHVNLLCDAGIMKEVGKSTYRITAYGHDYLDAIRDEGIWSKTKAALAESGGSATLDILKQLATGFLKKKISQHTGIDL